MLEVQDLLTRDQLDSYREKGYVRIEQVFTPDETAELAEELDFVIETWALRFPGWTGSWRQAYMDEETEKKSELIALHDLHYYSAVWARAIVHPKLVRAVSELVGGPTEFHHSTMHVKPPEAGHPFPMHQDHPFYPHADDRYVDVLVHLDDTEHANGEIRFLERSHRLGPLEHIVEVQDGMETSPYLPTDEYRLEDTVPVPARAGDIVCFNINTIHGSYMNTTDRARRLVRMGYRHVGNSQLSGQSVGRPGIIVSGRKPRTEEEVTLHAEDRTT